jgi:hypothetical protein
VRQLVINLGLERIELLGGHQHVRRLLPRLFVLGFHIEGGKTHQREKRFGINLEEVLREAAHGLVAQSFGEELQSARGEAANRRTCADRGAIAGGPLPSVAGREPFFLQLLAQARIGDGSDEIVGRRDRRSSREGVAQALQSRDFLRV